MVQPQPEPVGVAGRESERLLEDDVAPVAPPAPPRWPLQEDLAAVCTEEATEALSRPSELGRPQFGLVEAAAASRRLANWTAGSLRPTVLGTPRASGIRRQGGTRGSQRSRDRFVARSVSSPRRARRRGEQRDPDACDESPPDPLDAGQHARRLDEPPASRPCRHVSVARGPAPLFRGARLTARFADGRSGQVDLTSHDHEGPVTVSSFPRDRSSRETLRPWVMSPFSHVPVLLTATGIGGTEWTRPSSTRATADPWPDLLPGRGPLASCCECPSPKPRQQPQQRQEPQQQQEPRGSSRRGLPSASTPGAARCFGS